MIEISEQTLSERGDLIVNGIETAFNTGLSRERIKSLHNGETQRLHQDALLVYLGLKPAAVMLKSVFNAYKEQGIFYLSLIQSDIPDVNVRMNLTGNLLWDAVGTREVLEENPPPRSFSGQQYSHNPENSTFGEYLFHLSFEAASKASYAHTLGLLCGFPPNATEFALERKNLILSEAKRRWDFAQSQKIPLPPLPQATAFFTKSDKNKKLFIDLGKLAPTDEITRDDAELADELVATIRLANIPGFRYITYSDDTADEEAQLREQYEQSGIESKLKNILD